MPSSEVPRPELSSTGSGAGSDALTAKGAQASPNPKSAVSRTSSAASAA